MRKTVHVYCLGTLFLCLFLSWYKAGYHSSRVPPIHPAADTALSMNPGLMLQDKSCFPSNNVPAIDDVALLVRQIENAIGSQDPGSQAAIFTNQLPALIKLDPEAAARLAESPEIGEWRTELMRVTAQGWATVNPGEAVNWVTRLSDSNEQDTMLGCICFKVAENDLPKAVEIMAQQDLNDRRETMLCNLVQSWAVQDMASAFAWVNNYGPGNTRDKLFMHVALAENGVDPKAAAQIVATQIAPGEIQEEAAFSVVDHWVWQDLQAASKWVSQFPDSPLKERSEQLILRITESRHQIAGYEALSRH